MKDKFALKICLAIGGVAIVIALAVVAMPSNATTTPCVYSPLEQRGSHSTCVGYIQKMLNGLNTWHHYDSHAALVVDNDFGALTQAKAKAYQKFLLLQVDGIVGPKTWQALCGDARAMFVFGTASSTVTLDVYNAGRSAGCSKIVSSYNIY